MIARAALVWSALLQNHALTTDACEVFRLIVPWIGCIKLSVPHRQQRRATLAIRDSSGCDCFHTHHRGHMLVAWLHEDFLWWARLEDRSLTHDNKVITPTQRVL